MFRGKEKKLRHFSWPETSLVACAFYFGLEYNYLLAQMKQVCLILAFALCDLSLSVVLVALSAMYTHEGYTADISWHPVFSYQPSFADGSASSKHQPAV